jgi:hypothetical protein
MEVKRQTNPMDREMDQPGLGTMEPQTTKPPVLETMGKGTESRILIRMR